MTFTAKLGVVMLILSPLSALAQAKMNVFFTCQCDDPVGSEFATAFRDLLATSPRFQEVSNPETKDENGKVKSLAITVKVVSVDDKSPGSTGGVATALSTVVLIRDVYFNQQVQTCGRNVVKECAAATLAFVDKLMH